MEKIKDFIEGIRKEMKKVSWPTQAELVDNTIVTMVFSILLSLFIFLIDQMYSTILEALYQ